MIASPTIASKPKLRTAELDDAASDTTKNVRQHWRLTKDEWKSFYEEGYTSTPFYILGIVRISRSPGWPLVYKSVKDFCDFWGISRREFNRAINVLKRDKKLHVDTEGGLTFIYSDNKDIENTESKLSDDETKLSYKNRSKLSDDESKLSHSPQLNPYTASVTDSQQIYIDNKEIHTYNNVCEDEIFEEEELLQAANEQNLAEEESAETHLTAKERQDSKVPNGNAGFVQSSAAPPNKNSKNFEKQTWVFPGTEQEKQEFLQFKASLLVRDGLSQPIESLSYALAWANRYPEEASLLLASWREDKERKANHCASVGTSVETVPEFHQMPPEEHKALLEKFVHLGGNEFTKLCSWHKHWIEFALLPLGKKILSLNTETIQQMREVLRCQTV